MSLDKVYAVVCLIQNSQFATGKIYQLIENMIVTSEGFVVELFLYNLNMQIIRHLCKISCICEILKKNRAPFID